MPKQLNISANDVLATAWKRCKVNLLVADLWVSERQLRHWRAPISETETGQMNPLGRVDQVIAATQNQDRDGAIKLLTWLFLNFIERDTDCVIGSAQKLLALEQVSSEIKVSALKELAQMERNVGANEKNF